jgi:hypothetical protein
MTLIHSSIDGIMDTRVFEKRMNVVMYKSIKPLNVMIPCAWEHVKTELSRSFCGRVTSHNIRECGRS